MKYNKCYLQNIINEYKTQTNDISNKVLLYENKTNELIRQVKNISEKYHQLERKYDSDTKNLNVFFNQLE